MDMHPKLVVVGGPNGSGKSTFARTYAQAASIPYLGADDIAFELSPTDPFAARVAAGREFSRRLTEALAAGQSLVIESTLAGASLARSIAKARSAGYETVSILVFLDSPELCLRRISERVAQGGHDVPEIDVRRRFGRVFPVFWDHYRQLSHRCLVVFNGGESFLIVAESEFDNWEVYDANMWEKFRNLTKEVSHEDE